MFPHCRADVFHKRPWRKMSHHCGALSITAVWEVLRKASSGRNSDTLCRLCLCIQTYFVVEKPDLNFTMAAFFFSHTDKPYECMAYGRVISVWNIYLHFHLTTQSSLCSFLWRLFEKSNKHQSVSFFITFKFYLYLFLFLNQIKNLYFFLLFPQIQNFFVASYPPAWSTWDNICPRSKEICCWQLKYQHFSLLKH